jgi:hypothetical protein
MSIFNGSTKECVLHFGKNFAGNGRAVKSLVDFCEISHNTAVRWINGNRSIPLGGKNLIKLRYFLGAIGYAVSEVMELSDTARKLADIVATGIKTPEEATLALGFKINPDSSSENEGVYRVAQGKSDTSKSRKLLINKIYADGYELIEAKKRNLIDECGIVSSTNFGIGIATPNVATTPSVNKVSSKIHASSLSILANLIRAISPLAEEVASDEFSADERKKLRELCGEKTIFNLNNTLSMLCGERARNQIKANSN